ncbi:cation:dicarboxylate symporter family transporter [Pseudomonas bharatica]|uniref:cation:dicarboxylate symporter family transporter n=1 Tax=Pseudomonas bharatica TaxID=2692112 RepID=UPI0024C08D64|nr:cation:dicarboxylase symporter family transporter [Pseudomonas bharatica]
MGERGRPVLDVLEAVSQMVFRIFGYLMRFAPVGAFGALAFTVGQYGITSLGSLAKLVMTLYIACAFFVIVVLGAVCRFHGFSLWKLLRYFREEFLVVLGYFVHRAGAAADDREARRPGLPQGCGRAGAATGYSFNLDGTAIYLSLAAVFIAQACNIELGLGQTLTMLAIMLLSSKGAAGVTGSGFVALASTLTVIHDHPWPAWPC